MDFNSSQSNHNHNHNHKQQQQQEEAQENELNPFHVLAVDDSIIDRKLLEKLLTRSSYQVTCVESGDKALEYLGLITNHNINPHITTASSTSCSTSSNSTSSKQQLQGSKVNLIMTDYSMPGMSGYDLLKIVKESSWKDVPVVVMSSENVPSRINMCMEGGAKEFLLKPLKLSDLKTLQSQLLVDSNGNSISHEDADAAAAADDDEEKIKMPTNLVDEINSCENVKDESCIININTNKRKKATTSTEFSELRPKLVNDIVVS